MPDSNQSDRLAAKADRNRRERLDAIKRWVAYVEDNPPEVWGPQQNRVVNGQLESARQTGLSAEHERRVRTVAATLVAEFGEESDGGSDPDGEPNGSGDSGDEPA